MMRVVLAKLSHYLSFWKFVALHVAAMVAVAYAAAHLTDIQVQGSSIPFADFFTLPTAWRTACYLGRWLYFIPAFFVIQFVAAEMELKLVRAQIIAGLERHAIVVGWIVTNGLMALIGVAGAVVTVFLFGKSSGSGDSAAWAAITSIAGFFLYGLVFLTFAMLCAVVMRRPVPAIALLLLWPMAAEPLLGLALDHYVAAGVSDYLPFGSLSTLTPMPGNAPAFAFASIKTWVSAMYGIIAAVAAWGRLAALDL